MTRRRNGFTLIELMIVLLLGSVIVLAAYQILASNSQAYAAQNAKIEAMQLTRSSLDLITSELREVSSQGGDLVELGVDYVVARLLRGFGVVCVVTTGGGPPTRQNLARVTTIKVGDGFTGGDSLLVFAENDSTIVGDDNWIAAKVQSVSETTCQGANAQEITFQNTTIFDGDTVRLGGPVRGFEYVRLGRFNLTGGLYLGRRVNSGSPEALAGPFAFNDLRFTYFDANGNQTAVPTDVASVQVSVTKSSDISGVSDSLSARVFLRN